MKICTKCGLAKSEDMFYGEHAECKQCHGLRSKAWVTANRDKRKQIANAYAKRNSEKRKAYNAEYYSKNKAKIDARNKAYLISNPQVAKTKTAKWQSSNSHALAINCAKRRTQKIRAQPAWANEFFMAEAYHLAVLRKELCGGDWHVDHIVPLKSSLVCGLHVESNLCVIPAKENMRKSNRHWPDMP